MKNRVYSYSALSVIGKRLRLLCFYIETNFTKRYFCILLYSPIPRPRDYKPPELHLVVDKHTTVSPMLEVLGWRPGGPFGWTSLPTTRLGWLVLIILWLSTRFGYVIPGSWYLLSACASLDWRCLHAPELICLKAIGSAIRKYKFHIRFMVLKIDDHDKIRRLRSTRRRDLLLL